MHTDTHRFERRVLLLMALVQFTNIWDFMIVMPLGPDFARALGVSTGHIGWIAGSYSISAAITGVLSARFLDRFDRRSVLLFNLTGLMLATLSMSLARNLPELIMVRMITGVFGGPSVASSLAVIADVFPEHRRGEAVGKVFGSFSIAAVLGVPIGLQFSQWFGWWSPFVAVSAVAALAIVTIRLLLPPMKKHLHHHGAAHPPLFKSLRRNTALLPACLLVASGYFATFLIIPNISAQVQENMGYPRAWLGLLYFTGGVVAFFSMRFTGRYADRIGYARTSLLATLGLGFVIFIWFYMETRLVPVVLLFVFFMICSSTRNVTSNALISKIPHPKERAGFMSLMSATQHLAAGSGSMCSTLLLKETVNHRLSGTDDIALISMALFMIVPWMMFIIEKIVKRRREDIVVEMEMREL